MHIIQTLVHTDPENNYLYLKNGQLCTRTNRSLPTDNGSINTRLSEIVKFINSEFAIQCKIDDEKMSELTIRIHTINKKVERYNKKISSFVYDILRFILPERIHSLLGIEISPKLIFSELHASEQYAYNAPLRNLTQKQYLKSVSESEKESILHLTDFVTHKKWMGRLASSNITTDYIKTAGLEPAFQVTFGHTQCYLSKIFQAMQFNDVDPPTYQLAAIAYVKDDSSNRFKPRMVYLSGADNIWRIMPIKDGGRIGKGLEFAQDKPVKASTNVPFELALALNDLRIKAIDPSSNDTIVRWSENNSELLATIYNMIPDNVLNYIDESYQCTLPTRNASAEFTKVHTLEDLDLIHDMQVKHYPDFNTVEKYSIPGTFSDQVSVYRMFSLNKQYEYVFYEALSYDQKKAWRETVPHPWLASVRKIDAPLSTFLTSTTSCHLHGADVSGSEYWSYVQDAQIASINDEQILRGKIPNLHAGTTIPTWEIRKKFQIIELFEAWKARAQLPTT